MNAPTVRVELGRISGLYGVRGWVRVFSYTDPRTNIGGFPSWLVGSGSNVRRFELEAAREHGKGVVAKLRGIEDRDEARAWVGATISVERRELKPCASGEYYWVDLTGLEVRDTAGELLGRVDHMMATGANDVLVLEGPDDSLIPFVDHVVQQVDVVGGKIVVDWDLTSD